MGINIDNTSSIGACWPAEVSSNNRIRGFYPCVIEKDADYDKFHAEFEKSCEIASSLEIDRVSFRFCATSRIIGSLVASNSNIEAIIPLSETDDSGDGHFICYVAENAEHRKMTPEILASHRKLLNRAAASQIATDDPYKHITSLNGEINFIHNSEGAKTQRLVPAFLALYEKFGFSETDVAHILSSDDNMVAYVTNDAGNIICTALAERAQIPIVGALNDLVNIYEITEAVTHPDFTSQGFYRSLSRCLVDHLIERRNSGDEQIHAIYGESNLSSPGVIFAASKNGRKFSALDGELFGIKDTAFGILEQNYSVDDGIEKRPFNDFAVSYVPL